MKAILAIDSFKGCLTAAETVAAAAQGVREGCPAASVVEVPVTDGGDGMLEVFARALHASVNTVTVHDALMRRVTARYAVTADGTAIIESAEACGICRLKAEKLAPERATTYGVGELIHAAWLQGARHLIIGLGGSATSDCGLGMLKALTDLLPRRTARHDGIIRQKFLDDVAIPPSTIDLVSDVRNPLCGPDGAAAVFGPQKGATPDMVRRLDRRAATFARMAAQHCGYDCSAIAGAGAAGGLGYALMQFIHATVHPGADYFLDLIGFDALLADASIVITGEGSADRQTLMGKIPTAVMRRAQRHGVPTVLLAGRLADAPALLAAGFVKALCINDDSLSKGEDPLDKDVARRNIASAVRRLTADLR